jgi:hypothetical protein
MSCDRSFSVMSNELCYVIIIVREWTAVLVLLMVSVTRNIENDTSTTFRARRHSTKRQGSKPYNIFLPATVSRSNGTTRRGPLPGSHVSSKSYPVRQALAVVGPTFVNPLHPPPPVRFSFSLLEFFTPRWYLLALPVVVPRWRFP